MANTKSAIKYIRKTATRTERNTTLRSRLKTLAKSVEKAESPEQAKALAQVYVSTLDKAAKVGVIHPRKASRHKSSVSKYIFGKA